MLDLILYYFSWQFKEGKMDIIIQILYQDVLIKCLFNKTGHNFY